MTVGNNRYAKDYFKASDISRDDLEYNLVFMNTCESTDRWYRPIRFGENTRIIGFSPEYETQSTHAVRDIGTKLNALSYVGWDCSVERDVSAHVPSMLMEELDTRTDGTLRAASDAVRAVNETLSERGGRFAVFTGKLRCLIKEGAYERVIDLNKKRN